MKKYFYTMSVDCVFVSSMFVFDAFSPVLLYMSVLVINFTLDVRNYKLYSLKEMPYHKW